MFQLCFSFVYQLEQLYVEVLYTITNKVGASTGQYAHYKEDLYSYAQEAFGIPNDVHRKFMAIASEEKVRYLIKLTFYWWIWMRCAYHFDFFTATIFEN